MRADGKSNRSLKRWYSIINRRFFNSQLPTNVIVRWSLPDEESDIASCNHALDKRHAYVLLFNRAKIATRSQLLSALAHECIHCQTGMHDNHGPAFALIHTDLVNRGLYRKHALLHGDSI